MKVRIDRGAHEIGGNCVEVEAAGRRLVLDVGRPLSAVPERAPHGGDEHSTGRLEPSDHQSESEVEAAMSKTMRATHGMVLVVSSAQNIDRLVTVYRAAKRSGRRLVMDLYTASIAAATGNPNIPRPGPDWPLIDVYVPFWQRVRVKEAEAFFRVAAVRPERVYEDWLAEHVVRSYFFSRPRAVRLSPPPGAWRMPAPSGPSGTATSKKPRVGGSLRSSTPMGSP